MPGQSLLKAVQEKFTKFLTWISSDHNYIHAGKGFTSLVNTGSISAAYYVGFTTPTVASNAYMHWRPASIYSSADFVLVEVYEGDSFSSGSEAVPINRNRNSTKTTLTQAFSKGVTSTPTGTIIQTFGVGSTGIAASKSGGGGNAEEEIVLKPNTSYVVKMTPSGATTVISSFFWYEEGNGV